MLEVMRAQVSNDVRMLLPLLIGILVAKWVADATTHSLYHGLLEVRLIFWALLCLLTCYVHHIMRGTTRDSMPATNSVFSAAQRA